MRLLKTILEPANPQRARLAAAAPDVTLALIFLVTWIAPAAFGPNAVLNLVFVLVFEFVILHSSAVVVAIVLGRLDRGGGGRGILLFLSLFYALFAAGFAYVIGAWWPLWTIAALTLNRLTTLRRHEALEGRARLHVVVVWAMTFGFYFVLMFAVHLLPWPALGITDEIVAALTAQAGGSFVETPQVAMALGVIYYLGVGLADWYDLYAKATHRLVDRLETGTGVFGTFFHGVYRTLFTRDDPFNRDR